MPDETVDRSRPLLEDDLNVLGAHLRRRPPCIVEQEVVPRGASLGRFRCDRDAVAPVTRGVFLTDVEERLRVVVSPPAARSPAYGPRQLFTLEPGQRGRWRFNGRFTPGGCSCHSHQWRYEKWVVNVAYLSGTPASNLFTQCEPTYVVDDLVRLF